MHREKTMRACRCTSPNHGHAIPCPRPATEPDDYCKPCHEAAGREWAQTEPQFPESPQPRRLVAEVRTKKIVDELKKRGVTNDNCPRCGVFDWSVDFLDIPVRPAVNAPSAPPMYGLHDQFAQPIPTGFIRVVSLICKNCGYTIFHNLNVLETAK